MVDIQFYLQNELSRFVGRLVRIKRKIYDMGYFKHLEPKTLALVTKAQVLRYDDAGPGVFVFRLLGEQGTAILFSFSGEFFDEFFELQD